MISEITSNNNPAIKYACSLSSAKSRAQTKQHFIEGEKLVHEAVISGVSLTHVFADISTVAEAFAAYCDHVYIVPRHVMEKMCESRTPQHVCAIACTPDYSSDRQSVCPGFLVALDAVQDPGNVGTIIRTSDAFGASGVLLGTGCADPFSGKVIRASMGSVYHLPICRSENLSRSLTELKDAGAQLICGHLDGSSELSLDAEHVVIVIGNEGNGVSGPVADLCDLYRIPMKGKAESLNASVAASIMIYSIANSISF